MKKLDLVFLSIFPESLKIYFDCGMMRIAQDKKIVKVDYVDIRDFSVDKHRHVDDTPYGGGAGMIMQVEPIYRAWKSIRKKKKSATILLSAKGKLWKQALAKKYSQHYDQLIFICGRYEGVDERVLSFVDFELRIGDYVLSGGELPAGVIADSIVRLLPGVLGKSESLSEESHNVEGVLEYPQYTKPATVKMGAKNYSVPKVLLGGNHKEIATWREKKRGRG
jgi:tRNA (guanine37-N1)-methyltransferase